MNNRTIIMIALLAVVMMVGPASATVSAGPTVSPGVHFYGVNITVTWQSDSPDSSHIWINANTSWDGSDSEGWNMTDDLEDAPINGTPVLSIGTSAPYDFEYTFANWTVNSSNDCKMWAVYVTDHGVDTFSDENNATFMMNAYNVTIQDGRSTADGNSTLAGDQIKVYVTTSGTQAPTQRDGLPFSLTLPDNENDVMSGYVNLADSGNYTFTINATKAGVGAFRNITLSYGSPANFSWNSTQLAANAGLWSDTTGRLQFNVSELNLKAYDINGTADCDQNITSVNVTTELGGATIPANLSYSVNITLTCDPSNVKFNSTGGNNLTLNLTILAGAGESNQSYGNYSIPVNATLTLNATSEANGIITATVNTSGVAWTDGFVIHQSGDFNVLTAPSAATSYQIGKLVNITGWNSTGVAPTLNITDPKDKLINTTVVHLNPTDSSFEYTWDTNWTWNTMQTVTWNNARNKTGDYTLTLGNGSSAYIDTITITLNEAITAVPNTTSIPVNGTLWINGTTDRWNSNGTFMNCTISTASNKGGSTINNSSILSWVIDDFNTATGLATYNISWDSSVNLSEIVAAAAPVDSDTFDETYYITVNDSAAENTAATFQITDSITVNPATGVPGRNFTVTGASSRENGTIITVNVYSSGFPGNAATNNSTAIVYGNKWNTTLMNASYKDSGKPLSSLYTYTVVADDSIVKDTADLTLDPGSISLESLPDTTMDGIVWFNGTTDLGTGTIIRINVTNATGVLIGTANDTAKVDTTFNASWHVNTSLITGNFTAPVEQCNVTAYNGTIYSIIETLNVREDLVITTPDFEIAPGGEFKIEGTLNRVNTTSLTVETERAGSITNSTNAIVYGGQFNVTLEAVNADGGESLPNGEYTITVSDGTNASESITMTVVAATVTLANPADGETYQINDTISINGTSNIGNNTDITVVIQKISGPEGWTPFTATLYGTTDFARSWSTEWNTSADSTFQALDAKSGDYRFWAKNDTTYSSMPVITIAAVPTVDMIVESITPNCGGYLFGNESNNISAVIKNDGTGDAGASHACFVLSDGYSETVTVSALAAGANETVTITDPTIRNAGAAVTITVTADCNGEVTESNETNNVTTKDVTVVNNGYKGKTYTGGSNITAVKSYDLNGDLVYSVGDSCYLSGSSNWAAYDVAWTASDLPVTGTIREARLYVTYTWDKDSVMPGDVSMSFNGVAQTQDAQYSDRKGYDGYDYPCGMLAYNVTDDFNASGNIANLTNSHVGGGNVSMRGMLLVAIYEDASEPQRLIYVNEEFDMLYGGSGKCTTPEEATAWAPITGSIDVGTVANATLITVAPGAGPTEGELIFNGQVWTDVWNFDGDTEIGIDERDVTSYLDSADNLVGFRSSADYMDASNAFLVVTVSAAGGLTGDTNGDGIVDMDELFAAIDAYMAGTVDMDYLFGAIDAYMATA